MNWHAFMHSASPLTLRSEDSSTAVAAATSVCRRLSRCATRRLGAGLHASQIVCQCGWRPKGGVSAGLSYSGTPECSPAGTAALRRISKLMQPPAGAGCLEVRRSAWPHALACKDDGRLPALPPFSGVYSTCTSLLNLLRRWTGRMHGAGRRGVVVGTPLLPLGGQQCTASLGLLPLQPIRHNWIETSNGTPLAAQEPSSLPPLAVLQAAAAVPPSETVSVNQGLHALGIISCRYNMAP